MQRLVIITGASRGIGATLAVETSRKYDTNTLFLLMARNQEALERVKGEMLESAVPTSSFHVLTMTIDFAKTYQVAELSKLIKDNLQSERLGHLAELLVFYNHGTLKLSTIERLADDVAEEFQINVCSVWTLMSTIRQLFPLNLVPNQFHVNISSLLATQVKELYSAYNSTRSARATMFKCLALEQPNLRVLNYQPGPVETDMLKQIVENDPSFNENEARPYILTSEATVKRLLRILDKNKFENGCAIDYYDPETE